MNSDTLPAEIDDVLTGRAVIDGVDEEILRLVERRRVLSRRVQELRRRDGALGVQHARENEIIARYATALGRPGAELALLLLGVCKREGDIPRQVPA
jgi:chorismate mutase